MESIMLQGCIAHGLFALHLLYFTTKLMFRIHMMASVI